MLHIFYFTIVSAAGIAISTIIIFIVIAVKIKIDLYLAVFLGERSFVLEMAL